MSARLAQATRCSQDARRPIARAVGRRASLEHGALLSALNDSELLGSDSLGSELLGSAGEHEKLLLRTRPTYATRSAGCPAIDAQRTEVSRKSGKRPDFLEPKVPQLVFWVSRYTI